MVSPTVSIIKFTHGGTDLLTMASRTWFAPTASIVGDGATKFVFGSKSLLNLCW